MEPSQIGITPFIQDTQGRLFACSTTWENIICKDEHSPDIDSATARTDPCSIRSKQTGVREQHTCALSPSVQGLGCPVACILCIMLHPLLCQLSSAGINLMFMNYITCVLWCDGWDFIHSFRSLLIHSADRAHSCLQVSSKGWQDKSNKQSHLGGKQICPWRGWFETKTSKGNGTIRSVVLLEEIYHCGGGLWGLINAKAMPSSASVHFLLPTNQYSLTLSSSIMSACVPPCHTLMLMDWTSKTVS